MDIKVRHEKILPKLNIPIFRQIAALVLAAVAACEAIGATSYANSNLLSLSHGGLGYGGYGAGVGAGIGYGAGIGGYGAGLGGLGAGYGGYEGHDHYVSWFFFFGNLRLMFE